MLEWQLLLRTATGIAKYTTPARNPRQVGEGRRADTLEHDQRWNPSCRAPVDGLTFPASKRSEGTSHEIEYVDHHRGNCGAGARTDGAAKPVVGRTIGYTTT